MTIGKEHPTLFMVIENMQGHKQKFEFSDDFSPVNFKSLASRSNFETIVYDPIFIRNNILFIVRTILQEKIESKNMFVPNLNKVKGMCLLRKKAPY